MRYCNDSTIDPALVIKGPEVVRGDKDWQGHEMLSWYIALPAEEGPWVIDNQRCHILDVYCYAPGQVVRGGKDVVIENRMIDVDPRSVRNFPEHHQRMCRVVERWGAQEARQ